MENDQTVMPENEKQELSQLKNLIYDYVTIITDNDKKKINKFVIELNKNTVDYANILPEIREFLISYQVRISGKAKDSKQIYEKVTSMIDIYVKKYEKAESDCNTQQIKITLLEKEIRETKNALIVSQRERIEDLQKDPVRLESDKFIISEILAKREKPKEEPEKQDSEDEQDDQAPEQKSEDDVF